MLFNIVLIALICISVIVVHTCFLSFFEWYLHKNIMHKPLGNFDYAFKAHAVVHHQTFKADPSYHLDPQRPHEARTIPMAWWNGPVLIIITLIPATLVCVLIQSFTPAFVWKTIAITCALTSIVYYSMYEYIHWCMHLPKHRRIEFSWLFRKLNGHHLLHHRYMQNNLNVVLPLADYCLGTLLLRAKTPFMQPTGYAVPNVQPLPSTPEKGCGGKPSFGR